MSSPSTGAGSGQQAPLKRRLVSISDGSRKRRLLESASAKAESILAELSANEKISLFTCADHWTTMSLPSKGIPSITMSWGCNGVVGGAAKRKQAAQFPCGTSLAATWNKRLVYQVSQHLANEARARSAQLLLAPNVCLHRHPLGGLNTSSFSEDPVLTGLLASQYVKGLQDKGIAAGVHYFMGNTQEQNPVWVEHYISERSLRELYLRPFQITLREADPWAVSLSGYQFQVVPALQETNFVKDVLRKEWKYEGHELNHIIGTMLTYGSAVFPHSDGEDSVVTFLEDGCDIGFVGETDGPFQGLHAALKTKDVSMKDIDEAARNLLTLVERVKTVGSAEVADPLDSGKVIRTAGHEGLTLLKNDGHILPLCTKTTKVAVIGPNANRAVAASGGRAFFNPYYSTIPLQTIRQLSNLDVPFAQGCEIRRWLPLEREHCTNDLGEPGISVQWFSGDKFEGDPKLTEHRNTTNLLLGPEAPEDLVSETWSALITTSFKPQTTGTQTMNFSSTGIGQLYVDGKLAGDTSVLWDKLGDLFNDPKEHLVTLETEQGKAIKFEIKMTSAPPDCPEGTASTPSAWTGCQLGFEPKKSSTLLQEAVEVAQGADIAVVIVGLDHGWDIEGLDRDTMDLPFKGSQDKLIEAVVRANPRTIVINQSGGPVHMPWAEKVPAIIQAWYQGQEAGKALADVPFGLANPSGKLPMTFPKRIGDTPAVHSWLNRDGNVLYGEELNIGYRHYDRTGIAPLFPFGHGLSYTTFEYGYAQVQPRMLVADGNVQVTLAITNTGSRAGAETVQVYIHDEESKLPRPDKELVAFEKVFLDAGETEHITFTLDKHAVGFYDESIPGWLAEEGTFEVLIGASSSDIRRSAKFSVEESFNWVF